MPQAPPSPPLAVRAVGTGGFATAVVRCQPLTEAAVRGAVTLAGAQEIRAVAAMRVLDSASMVRLTDCPDVNVVVDTVVTNCRLAELLTLTFGALSPTIAPFTRR